MGPHEAETLLLHKGNHQLHEGTAHRMKEILCCLQMSPEASIETIAKTKKAKQEYK